MTIEIRRVGLTVVYLELVAREIYFAASEKAELSDVAQTLRRLGEE